MIVCQVDARIPGLGMEAIEEELRLLEEVLAAIEGELVCAEVSKDRQSLLAYVRAESELVVSDIFDCCQFVAERIAYLGPVLEARAGCDRPKPPGAWRYRPPAAGALGIQAC